MENKFKEFWIELEEKGARAFVYTEPVDGLNDDAIHTVEYAALESANAEILNQLKHFNEKLNAKDAEIAAWKVKNDTLRWDKIESENARLRDENVALKRGIDDMEKAVDKLKDGLAENLCGYCEQSMNSDQNPSYEQLVVANDFNQQEIAKLKEENAQLSKYCGEVRAWQNRAEDLSEEKEKLKEQNSGLIEALEHIASPKRWAIDTFVPEIRDRVKIARDALKKWGEV